MTGRHMKVLKGGKESLAREIWRGCAVFDKEASAVAAKAKPAEEEEAETVPEVEGQEPTAEAATAKGFTIDEPKGEEQEDDEEDELAFHTFELMDALEVFKHAEKVDVQHAMVPSDHFLKLLELLLLIAPLSPQESVSLYGAQLDEKRVDGLRTAAQCILASFGIEQVAGIRYHTFDTVVSNTLPHLFDSFAPLFEHFLFPKDFDLSKRKDSTAEESPPLSSSPEASKAETASKLEPEHIPAPEPLLPVQGDILNLELLSQLSFIFSGDGIFHRLRPLYLGHNHGYSMGSFEKSVFKWEAPSILLVSGTIISPSTRQSHARSFLEDIPHRRLSSSTPAPTLPAADSSKENQRITYGAYIPMPWKSTHKTTFGTEQTTLFQLSPVHDVFPASSLSQHYIYFNKPPTTYTGLGFGSPLPSYSSMTTSQVTRRQSLSYSASDASYTSPSASSFSAPSFRTTPPSPGLTRRSSLVGDEQIPLGPVSLHIDDALQFAVFTHLASGGGSFRTSRLPLSARPGAQNGNWQDRFEIDAIEVWGIGDASVAEGQRRAWLWEEKEAERRRRVNLGTGDVEADKELLRMAGLVKDEARSGGSMG